MESLPFAITSVYPGQSSIFAVINNCVTDTGLSMRVLLEFILPAQIAISDVNPTPVCLVYHLMIKLFSVALSVRARGVLRVL
jgi:hypothetical protein